MKLFALFATIVIGLQANAGFLVDPYLAYDSGTNDSKLKSDGSDSGAKTTATAFGVRLGYKLGSGLWFAVDPRGASGKTKYNVGTTEPDFSQTTSSFDVGYDAGMFRGYFGYGFSDSFTNKETGSELKFTGTSMRVGVGAKVANHFSILFEYSVLTMKDIESGGTTLAIADVWDPFTTNIMSLALTFPFDFGK